MKIRRIILLVLFISAFILNFSACSSKDSDNKTGTNNSWDSAKWDQSKWGD